MQMHNAEQEVSSEEFGPLGISRLEVRKFHNPAL